MVNKCEYLIFFPIFILFNIKFYSLDLYMDDHHIIGYHVT